MSGEIVHPYKVFVGNFADKLRNPYVFCVMLTKWDCGYLAAVLMRIRVF